MTSHSILSINKSFLFSHPPTQFEKYQILITYNKNCNFMQGEESPTKSPDLSKKKSSVNLTADDFSIKYTLGRGAYGDVFLVQKNSDKKLYAMKQIQKRKLERQRKEYQALIQKEMLTVLKHPAIIKLRYAFQEKKSLNFVLEWCEGGGFLQFIKLNIEKLSEQIKRFYIAEIVNILQYIHSVGVVHRDIKPQNIMLSSTGHLKLIDFGTAQISKCTLVSSSFKERIQNMKQKSKNTQELEIEKQHDEQQSPRKKQRRSTFVGSCYYLSPELVEENYCPPEADLWALGCIIYQLYYRESPFKDHHQFAVYEKIKKCEIEFPKNKDISEQAIDLIKKLLKKNPDQRLGSGKTPQLTYQKLKQHSYFKGLNVDKVFQMQIPKLEELKEPQMPNQQKIQLEQKKQKTRTQFSKQMLSQISSINKPAVQKKIIMHGLVQKKTFIKYSFYYLIAYDDLSIERIKSEEPEKKKFYQIDNKAKQLPAVFIEDGKFQLNTTQKKYPFKCQNNAKIWVDTINQRFKVLSQNP